MSNLKPHLGTYLVGIVQYLQTKSHYLVVFHHNHVVVVAAISVEVV